jgi:hypothetical protein
VVKIAKEVYQREEIALQDGTEVTLMPLPIAKLKRFMKAFNSMQGVDFEKAENEDLFFDIMIDCCGICLERDLKNKFDQLRGNDGAVLSEEYKDYLEDVLDSDTINRIFFVCAGMKLDAETPKVPTATTEDGTN